MTASPIPPDQTPPVNEREALRRASVPAISYPEQLPVTQRRQDIADALQKHQVIVVAGETGSGKTTQIPKICLELGYGVKGLIGHTQPRRLAARSVATRIAQELQVPLGAQVGYQVRFSDHTAPGTLIKLMTDGILLAEIQHDRLLKKYEVLIIDEAHERSLNIDFLLGYLRQLLPRRPDLKVIITSATIDVEKFSAHFGGAPVISVSGRTWPVEILYRPPEAASDEGRADDSLAGSVLAVLAEIEQSERRERRAPGDVLVFLSGEREIRDLALELRKHPPRNTEVLPLYARLTPAEQARIFAPHTGRRIILSTNVAETSLTVPGIIYVIDAGYARISRYSVQSKVQRLPIERISQASANQRAGRCGRVANGICYRLYSEEDFLSRPLFTDPEIQRTSLASVILQMLMLGLGDIDAFPFVERPERKAINDVFKLLFELGAIDRERKVTANGRKMAAMPTDPRLACMLVEAERRGCLQELLIIASALSVQDPRENPPDRRQQAREKHRLFEHPESDFLSWVILWTTFEQERQNLGSNALRQYCRTHFLSFLRMREWRETHRQLHLSCQQLGLRHNRSDLPLPQEDIDYEQVHRAIIRGSLNQLGTRTPEGQYLGSRNRKFALFPTSALHRKSPRWVVTAELIETSRLYATLAARIEPAWAVDAAPYLLKRDYFEAHWEKTRGQVVAFERISLFGLVLVEKQRVSYSHIDPVLSREIFIREALVERQLQTRAAFYQHNQKLLETLRREEEKQRRPDIVVGEDQMAEFYSSRIPPGISDSRSLERWLRTLPPENARILHMTREDLLQRELDGDTDHNFPDQARIQDNVLPIQYRFKPGQEDDGAVIKVPVGIISAVTEADLDWSIPGQLRERCIQLLKGLPKGQRKLFIPIPEFVDEFLARLQQDKHHRQRALIDHLREYARRYRNVELDRAVLEQVALPQHLLPAIAVVDEQGKQVARSHSLNELKQQFVSTPVLSSADSERQARHPLEREGLTDWSFGDLPAEVSVKAGITIRRYPALVDQGRSVAILLQDDRDVANRLSRAGLARLFMLRTAQQRSVILKRLKLLEKQLMLKMPAASVDFGEECLLAIYQIAFEIPDRDIPDNRQAFEAQLNAGKGELLRTGERFERLLTEVVEAAFEARRKLGSLQGRDLAAIRKDIEEQLNGLVYPGYLAATPPQWLLEYPRYFKAIAQRLDKLPQQVARDLDNLPDLVRLQSLVKKVTQSSCADSPAGVEFRWMVEELRVSLFAQTLGTRMPVSVRRLEKKLAELEAQGFRPG